MLVRSTFRIATVLTGFLTAAAVIAAPAASAEPAAPAKLSSLAGGSSVTQGGVQSAGMIVNPALGSVTEAMAAAAAATRQHVLFANSIQGGTFNRVLEFGNYGEQVFAGDFNGDGKDDIALRRGNVVHYKTSLASSAPTYSFQFGFATDQLLVGDWNGDGKDSFGVRRGNSFILRNSLNTDGSRDIKINNWGLTTDRVVVGDWDGNRTDTLALQRGNQIRFRNALDGGPIQWAMSFGEAGDIALAGDWNGKGKDTIALRRGTTIYLRFSTTTGLSEARYTWGASGDKVIVGDWVGAGVDKVGAVRPYDARYRVWELVNQQRAAHGVKAVTYNDSCLKTKYSESWAIYMANTSQFKHQELARGLCNPDAMAENIAAGYTTADAVMSGWMNSPGHKANILSTARTTMSLGIAKCTDKYGIYWVQNFH